MNKIVPIILFFVFAFIAQVFSSPTDTTVVYCDSVVLGNDTFYNDTVVSVPGEDAKEIMMHIIINHKVTLSISDTVCNSYTWNDSTYTSSGVYTQTFTASNGCDSIVTLNLTVIPPPDPPTVTDTSRCGAGALTLDVAITDPNWIVQWFADSTTVDVLATGLQYSTGSLAVSETPYLYYVQSVNDHYQNCNSKRVAITAMVNAIPERPMVTEYTNCGPGSFQLTPDNTNSCHWYLAPTATSYTETTPFATGYISESTSFFVSNVDSTNGCESGKVEFPVIIYPIPDTVDIYDVACKGNPYTEYGLDIVFSSEGEKHFVLPLLESFHGCDSVRILHVNVLLPQQYSFEDTACDIYTWNDSTYTSSGVYTQTFTASNGCDSIVTLNLTVKQSTSAIEPLTLCSTQLPYSYNDTLLITTEGNYIFTIPNEAGCDSVVTLAVTVIPSPSEPAVSSVTRCGPGSVTLQASAGQNGTTCYWYSTEDTAETIHTGANFQSILSETTVFYVASVNESTGCVSTRVADTAIVFTVPSSPNVADAARCGAGPVTMDVTVADMGWTVQWFANDTTAEVLAAGVQYTTDTLPVSTSPYVYYVQSADEHCPSHRVMVSVMVNPVPSEPTVSNATSCGPDTVTLQAIVGQNGTTCYWYSTEETSETIHTGTSYRFFLSDTTVLYVASMNEATGCVSTRVSDTAIVYNVPSSPNVADAARCGAGPVTMDVTVADTGWTVQWFANDTTAEVLAAGVQYTTDTLPVSTSPYVYYVQSADEHCPSHRVMVSVMVNPVPSEPTVSNATSCGPDTVTLQAIVGQNGTTCYWYSTEETSETIHTGTSYRFFLSDTTVLYVASVNEATGCVSTRVADTAIVFTVPSSPNVADTARCGAGPVTMDVTVADTGWTVQWFANDTTAEVLAAGVQYTTDTLPVSTSPYVYYVQSADEHCPSHRVMVSVMVNPVPSEPTVSNATSCGPDTVTLQAIVGQNGTTCYWYSTEETSETIHTGTSYRFFLSDTTVLYVASMNEATGCVSTRVSDTAIVYNVPSSPNVADASRCGAGPVTMDVTVADTGWTVQWFANDTTAEVLATGVQYTTDTLPVSTAPYMYYVQSADEHCQSSREMIIVTVNAIPEMYAIIGDTSVCRNQYVEYRYPVDDSENYRYVWYFFSDPDQDSTLEYNIPVWERYIEDSVSQVITVGMYVQDLQTNCMNDTSLTIHVSEEFSPDRTQIVRKNNSNILIYNNSSSLPSDIHYRWGYTDKLTFEETVVQDWIYNYYQYSFIDTIQFRYWVEAYVFYEDDTCRNRTYYLDEVVTIQDYFEDFDVIAFISGNQLQIQVDNPSGQHTVAVLYDMAGRTIAQWDLGIDSVIRKQISFGYPNGIYLLTVQVGNRRHTTKILNQQ